MHTMAMQYYYLILSLLCIIFTSLLSSILKKRLKNSSNNHLRLPPSPPALPLIGHLHLLSLVVHKSLADISNKYGPLLYLRVGFTPYVVVSSASVATEFFKTHDANFSYRPKSVYGDTIFFGDSGFLAAPYGDYWRFMKKLCVTELLGIRHLERSRSVRREEIMNVLRKVLKKASKKEVVDVGSELGTLASTVLFRMVTGAGFSEENSLAQMMKKMVEESVVLTAKVLFADSLGPFRILASWMFEKRAKDIIGKCDEILESFLEEHEERAKRDGERSDNNKDLMDILLGIYHDDKAEFKITKHNIKAFLLVFIKD